MIRKVIKVILLIFIILYLSPVGLLLIRSIVVFTPEFHFTADNYIEILFNSKIFTTSFLNSVVTTSTLAMAQTVYGTIMAFVFSKIKFRFRQCLYFVYVVAIVIPFQVTMIPVYLMLSRVNILNSFSAVVLPLVFVPFGVIFLKQFMEYIPQDILEAASLDGASGFHIFYKIIVPVCKNSIILLFFLSFVENWANDRTFYNIR